MSSYTDFALTGLGKDITSSWSASNPWAANGARTGASNLLAIAQQCGYQVCTDEMIAHCQYLRETTASARYFSLMKEIASLDAQLAHVNLDLQKSTQDQGTHDLTNVTLLEKRLGRLMQLSTHLNDVLRCKDAIVQRLKQPYSGDCLQVELANQRHVIEVFKLASSLLTDLTYHIENIEWNQKQLKSVTSGMEKALYSMTAASDAVHASMATVDGYRSTVARLHEHRKLDTAGPGITERGSRVA